MYPFYLQKLGTWGRTDFLTSFHSSSLMLGKQSVWGTLSSSKIVEYKMVETWKIVGSSSSVWLEQLPLLNFWDICAFQKWLSSLYNAAHNLILKKNYYKNIYIYLLLFIYLFLAMLGLCCCVWPFSGCGKWGLLTSCGAWASHCGDLSCCGVQALDSSGFSSCCSQAHGPVVVAHRLSCSAGCGIFLDQELNPCPLHWQMDS